LVLNPQASLALIVTVALQFFTTLQGFEYVTAPFTISDGVYGSTFTWQQGYGFHVLLGHVFSCCWFD
jgi:cytochrome c oxidase subunit 3